MDGLLNKARRLLAAGLLCLAGGASAGEITYRFDTFADSTALTTQYAGLSFAHATVLTSGISLNDISFPPHSGDGVVYDDGGAIVITFDQPATSVSGYFTYVAGLTLSAYDSADNLLATSTAAWLANPGDGTGDPGSAPNELLSVSSIGDRIARVVISGHPDGGSLVLDDLTVGTAAVAIPEPGTLPLLAGGLLLAMLCRARPRLR